MNLKFTDCLVTILVITTVFLFWGLADLSKENEKLHKEIEQTKTELQKEIKQYKAVTDAIINGIEREW